LANLTVWACQGALEDTFLKIAKHKLGCSC